MVPDRRLAAYRDDLADIRLKDTVTAPVYRTGQIRQVIVPHAPLFKIPDARAMVETTLLFGEQVLVFDQENDFAWVQAIDDDYVGYVPTASLGPDHVPTHRIAVPRTHLYPEPDLKTRPVMALGFGARLTISPHASPEKGFLQIDGGQGWVYRRHILPLPTLFSDHVALAERFLGIPYIWGGRDSADGIDCSALVQMVLMACGIRFPRDSDMQRDGLWSRGDWGRCPLVCDDRLAESVPDITGLMRGDLVFFPGHVGIIHRPGYLLHANASHMAVAIDPLDHLLMPAIGRLPMNILAVRRPLPG